MTNPPIEERSTVRIVEEAISDLKITRQVTDNRSIGLAIGNIDSLNKSMTTKEVIISQDREKRIGM